jgi:hypothetical protein
MHRYEGREGWQFELSVAVLALAIPRIPRESVKLSQCVVQNFYGMPVRSARSRARQSRGNATQSFSNMPRKSIPDHGARRSPRCCSLMASTQAHKGTKDWSIPTPRSEPIGRWPQGFLDSWRQRQNRDSSARFGRCLGRDRALRIP